VEDLEEEVANVLSEDKDVVDNDAEEKAEEEETKGKPKGDGRHVGGQQLYVCAVPGPSAPQPQHLQKLQGRASRPARWKATLEVEANTVHATEVVVQGAILRPQPCPCPILKAPLVVQGPGCVT
jgi:hypothetical protein